MTKIAMRNSVNRRVSESPGVAERYRDDCDLMKAEAVILEFLRRESRDQALLEIGVGGGRITPHLLAITKDYTGIDYSARMVEMCRQRFASTFLVCDARDMSVFGDSQFSTVVFWGNGIDDVRPSDRLVILNEANRLLKRNGIFAMSSHNIEWSAIPSYLLEGFSIRRKSFRDNAMRALLYLRCGSVRLWTRIWQKGYGVISEYEEPLRLAVPVYFVKKETQVLQLMEAGFHQVEALASDGTPLNDANRSTDYLVFYTARKK